MKKLFTILTFVLFGHCAKAQPWLPNTNKPVKLLDVIESYNRNLQENEADDEMAAKRPQIVVEGKNYQFDRWLWYWKNHTDENGYIVPTMRTWEEWQAYLRQSWKQKILAKTTGVSSYWTFQGPVQALGGYNGIGRINCIAFHPIDANTLWIGSAGGGPWKTTDGGSTWAPMYNNLPVLGVSDIKMNPLNPNTVYLCTGDGDGNDNNSVGVFKSTDGGNTWDTTSLHWNSSSAYFANSLVINPLDTNTLLLGTSTGIYRSIDAGNTWTNVQSGYNFKQVVYNPTDTNIIYATSYNPSNIFRSANGGLSWAQITNVSDALRVAIAVTPANPGIVKAVFANYYNGVSNYGLEGIYSSSDTGKTFIKICGDSSCSNNILSGNAHLNGNACGGQGWYDLCIAISLTDTNQVLVGGVNTYQSTNGGISWTIVTQWISGLAGIKVVHADKHFMAFNPLTPSVLYQGNDGGIYKSTNTNNMWTDLSNGIAITQFYRIALSDIANYVIGGAQDNGTKLVHNGLLSQLTGGDGMDCKMDYTDTNTFYTSSQYGSFSRTQDHGAHYTSISNNISSPAPTGSWVTPIVIHPQAPNIILTGFDKVYLSIDYGQSWNPISQVFSSGKTIDRIAMSYNNGNYIYILVNNIIYYTIDFGNTWHNITGGSSGTISDIVADQKNENILWITYSGYTTNKVGKHSLTTNSWTYINAGLPNIPVNCFALDSSSGTMYVGADLAVFYKDTTMSQWALFNTNLPNVMIDDIAINYTTSELWAATYGRGFWKTPKYDQSTTGISIIPFVMDIINVSPNPNKGNFTVSTDNKNLVGHTVTARLINNTGKTTWQANDNFNSSGVMNINAEGLAKGVYILEIAEDNMIARSRVVVY